MAGLIIATLALAVWVYLMTARGRYWLAGERDDRREPGPPAVWPRVTAVIPARMASSGFLNDNKRPSSRISPSSGW